MARGGLAPDERNAILLWGDIRRALAVFDPQTLQIRAILKPHASELTAQRRSRPAGS
jgi:hypothetical protein